LNTEKISDAKTKLLEVNDFVKKLDESLRENALKILLPMYFEFSTNDSKPKANGNTAANSTVHVNASDTSDLGSFISAFDQSKPADNVALLVAWLYSQHGSIPISAKHIQELGNSCGLVVPGRPDNTMRQAKNEGKTLFQQVGKGWKLTVNGELHMKNVYKVTKGNKSLTSE
jgi:Tfp pilus assembly protein PilV